MTTKNELIVSVSGVRGIVGDTLTAETALAFATAFGTHLQGGQVLLSCDGRANHRALWHAVLAGLLQTGCHVTQLGIAPTPTVGVAVTKLQARGAIQLTASHNPAEWNGLKLFGSEGRVINAEEGAKVKDRYENRDFHYVDWQGIGQTETMREALTWHRDKVLQLIDSERIRNASFNVLLDTNGGSGRVLGEMLLDALGCEVASLGEPESGLFTHIPEPTEENLKDIQPQVPATGAGLGLAMDPDADRLALIDEQGHYIGEELTLALAARYRLSQQKGPVVINMSTSRVTEDVAKSYDCECHRSAVGEANVVDKMQEVRAVFGGEGNGGVIDPRIGWVRDPFIGTGLILNLMAETGKSLSELVAELPVYHIVKEKYPLERERLSQVMKQAQAQWPEAKANTLDGLRLDWERNWVHIRPSNTEPVVRVIAEAPERAAAERICQKVREIIEG